ncbi:molecular chaperone [Altererythrobacter sp. MF3-039]|uniref:fimbrial biogenesis chaperone n=1 Tax=Altererythrobacter sp. MF3-039 TaxID=3252901 RepID=UPI00390CD7F4
MRSLIHVVALLCAASGLWIAAPAQAQGDLLVAPTRVVLDGRRGAEVILSNIGDEEATYRISLELRRMTEDGSLVEVAKDSANNKEAAALEMIRHAPRRISLPPGQPQAVRIAARPGAELPDGEYRAHMLFRAIPKPRPIAEQQEAASGVSINLIPIYGISIPIIIRHGKVDVQAGIVEPQLIQGEEGPELHLGITREGASSTYGMLRVVKPGEGTVFEARGLAVYPELSKRSVVFRLTPEQAVLMQGSLRFEYRDMPEAGGGLIAALDTVFR